MRPDTCKYCDTLLYPSELRAGGVCSASYCQGREDEALDREDDMPEPGRWQRADCVGVGDFSLGFPRRFMEQEYSDRVWYEDDGDVVHRSYVETEEDPDRWYCGDRPCDPYDYRYRDIECTADEAIEAAHA